MKPTIAIDIPGVQLAEFCRRWQVEELSLFGSALRADFGPHSDVDLLVDFEPGTRRTLFDLVRMEEELEAIFGREVDLVEKQGVIQNKNPLRRRAILGSARVIYHAG